MVRGQKSSKGLIERKVIGIHLSLHNASEDNRTESIIPNCLNKHVYMWHQNLVPIRDKERREFQREKTWSTHAKHMDPEPVDVSTQEKET